MSNEEFSERVKKTFGNLLANVTPTPTPSTLSNPLWSLTGAEIEKRQWRRDQDTSDRDNNPCASSFDDFVSCARKNSRKNLKNYKKEFDNDDDFHAFDDDDDDGGDDEDKKGGDLDDWDLRGSIGLDSTLDNEDEEDDYDKVAIGRENAGDRLYMGAVADKNAPNFVPPNRMSPDSGDRRRDPRANRLAARIRLKEDDAEVGALAGKHKTGQAPPASAEKDPVSSAGDVNRVKPILKRKEHQESTSKPPKRVRFDPDVSDKNPPGNITRVNQPPLNDRVGRVAQIPDYVQNPSKYTCYSLDSSNEINDKSNDGLHEMNKSQNSESRFELENALSDLPQSITFVPKRKSDSSTGDAVNCDTSNNGDNDSKHSSTHSALIASLIDEDSRESEVGDMEIDGPETSAELCTTSRIKDRQYRTKAVADEPE
ncbi:uncharacterized protein LOC141642662 [Silene latifolia]|uniref:uncharacterized protein LOC141642662 n=1 Tax=Silene latifolia TaxID=37657 RepID=UPI003D785D14